MRTKNWSKSSIAAILGLMIVSSGCSSNPSTSTTSDSSKPAESSSGNPVVVKAWYHQYGEKEAVEFLNNWTAEFNKSQSKIKLETTIVAGGVADYYSKLSTAFASGAGPDFFEMDASDFSKYVSSGIAAPLDDLITGDIRKDFNEKALAGNTSNGKLYGMPFIIDAIGLYYDKDVLKAANIQPPKTWDELRDAAKKLTTPERKGFTLSPIRGGYQNYEFWPFLWAAGGNVLDDSGKKSTYDSDATRKALQLYRDLAKDGSIYTTLQTDSWDINYLLSGKTAMQLSGIWATPTIEKSGKNIGLVPYPAVDAQGKQTSTLGGWNMIVNSKGRQAEAKEVIRWFWLEGTDRMGQFNTIGGFHLAPRKSVLEAKKDIYSKPIYKDWVDTVVPLGRKDLSLPPEVVTATNDAVQEALFSMDRNIDTIVKDADKKVKEALAK
ncbi:ABC transporter substrate-binding protein [Paenibacillus alba]|uniref:ABC transporter substrate-binding protein n=1 Tax=Paenibacillus alba TaxID=1197127 RepID=A0ABU6G279_9BACL|nr:ABC transporter substrate-binding protein [Paenibacillus alba]MEC0227680.1 ABC transporter substrate-binding protein [Paenibacillus alba]